MAVDGVAVEDDAVHLLLQRTLHRALNSCWGVVGNMDVGEDSHLLHTVHNEGLELPVVGGRDLANGSGRLFDVNAATMLLANSPTAIAYGCIHRILSGPEERVLLVHDASQLAARQARMRC